MTNPATAADLSDRFFRALTARELEIAQVWLDDAWGLVVDRRPTIEADIASGAVSSASVVRVLVAMVSRVFTNPEGKLSEDIDDYSYRRDSAVSAGALYVSDDELGQLVPYFAGHRRSVRLVSYGEFP